VQLLDYYPFGATRVSTSTYPTNEKRGYIGQFTDPQTSLDYLNARYYDSSRGQFVNEDPIFQQIGDPNLLKQTIQQPNPSRAIGSANLTSAYSWNSNIQQSSRNSTSIWSEYLRNPQQQNAYSYSLNNPINYFDPTGDFGVFANWSAGANAGLGVGFAGSTEAGAGFTFGNSLSSPVDLGGYSSSGFLAGGPYGSATVEGVSGRNNNAVIGLSAGAGYGLMVTNATRISQLGGTGQSNNFSIGILSVSWSVSPSGIWTVSASIGAKPVVSFSTYPTATKTTTSISSASNNASSASSPCKVNCH
jgi:RHS repeat-associated protein